MIPIGMKRYVRVLTLSFAIALLGHIVVSAQSGPTGTLSGTVKDPSGALMPGVDITIRNTGTGQTRKAASDNVGRWVAPALAVMTRARDKMAVAASGLMPARMVDKAEAAAVVRQALETLGERQKMELLLSKFEGMSYQDIA